jgi:hypothetical protein
MTDKATKERRSYFSYEESAEVFNEALIRMLGQARKVATAKYLGPENTYRLLHGGDCTSPGNPDAVGGEMQQHSAFLETRFKDIVANDLSLIERSIQQISAAMDQQFATMFYSTISKTCDRTGNVVDAQEEGSLEAAFMAMMEKIELVADKGGNVTLPQVHVSPDAGARLVAALEATSPEYRERFEALKAKKIEEAVNREAERKAKFVRYGGDPCAS